MNTRQEQRYSVKELARLAGVSIRTLHHYDEIGLLKPAWRSEKNYRYYHNEQLYRLQQILFYRELDFPLAEIRAILDDPSFDLVSALESHKSEIQKRKGRLDMLLGTIEKTLLALTTKENVMKAEEMYEGFSSEEIVEIRKEVTERWGAGELEKTEHRVRSMGKERLAEVKQEGEAIVQQLADLLASNTLASDERVQQAIAEYQKNLSQFYPVDKERLLGLGQMYSDDPRFTAYYEKFWPGLADFVNSAIKVYCGEAG